MQRTNRNYTATPKTRARWGWLVMALACGIVPSTYAAIPSTATSATTPPKCSAVFAYTLRKLHSKDNVDLCALTQGKPVVVVNTASHCGFTSQFKELEALHQRYAPKGVVVLGVASDSFKQEDASEANAAKICFINFGVSFTMLAPINVKGAQAHPFFKGLTAQAGEPSWNFNKYIVSPTGQVIKRFGPLTAPTSTKLTQILDTLVQGPK